jgi:hypothetical protein
VLDCEPAKQAATGAESRQPTKSQLLSRSYREGERPSYVMKGVNEEWHYQIQAEGVVKKDSAGSYFEEFGWSNLVSNGSPAALSPETAAFRQRLTLDPGSLPAFPDVSKIDPILIGPVTDLMTFYVDLWLVYRLGKLNKANDRFYFPLGTPNSWADGHRVLLGEDSIDLEFSLIQVDDRDKVAKVLVRHVVPAHPQVKLPAEWMREPVCDTPNNWVQVSREREGSRFLAAVGRETFDVQLTVSLLDGRILTGSMDNVIDTTERTCEDEALTQCGATQLHSIRRNIEILLVYPGKQGKE